MRLSIIIPAYNEAERIANTLRAYHQFFEQKQKEAELEYEILVVINGTTDTTPAIVAQLQQTMPSLLLMNIPQGGKGLAIARGFNDALTRPNDLIGFVDADMATAPDAFYQLVQNIDGFDGIIASRYMKGAVVTPARPFYKRFGSIFFFDSLSKLFFGLYYKDTQCGAKLFKRATIETIAPHLWVTQWAFDVDLLYLCRRFGFSITEFPTVWHDQAGSKLRPFHAGFRMLGTLFKLRWHYWFAKED